MADFATLILSAETRGLKQAEPAIDAVIAKAGRADAAVRKMGAGAKQMGTDAQAGANQAKAALEGIEAEARQAEAALGMAAAGLRDMEQSALRAGQSSAVAAGSVGSLTAQVFDIGMMMQAGQNPFVLMIQQGSQVAQVLGPMGATGAVQAFKGVFAQLISPVNLATFAVIGLTAALVPMVAQLLAGGGSAEELKAKTDELTGSVDRFRATLEMSRAPVAELREEYGSLAEEMQRFIAGQAVLDQGVALAALKAQAAAALELNNSLLTVASTRAGLRAEFDAGYFSMGFAVDAEAARDLQAALNDLTAAASAENFSGMIDAGERFNAALIEAFGSAQAIPPEMQAVADGVRAAVEEAARLNGGLEDAEGAGESVLQVAVAIGNALDAAASADLASVFTRAQGAANALLAIARQTLATLQNAANVRAGNAFAITQGGQALNKYGGRTPNAAQAELAARNAPVIPTFNGGGGGGRGGGGGGGGGGRSAAAAEAEKEAQAIQKVVDNLKAEIEQVGASQEARRLHQELQRAGVTIYSEEGQQIAALVEQLTELEAKQKLVAETMRGIENAAQSFFVGVLSGAKDLKTAIGDLLKQLGNLFLNQAFKMLWEGKPGGRGGLSALFAGLFDMGGRIPAGQIGLVAEKRPEVVDGRLVTRPTLVAGPAKVTGGAATARMLDVPGPQVADRMRGRTVAAPAPRVTVTPPPVIVLDDPRRIDAWLRSPLGERTAAWQKRRMGNG